MNIDEAIKDLEEEAEFETEEGNKEMAFALQLGIEALERLQFLRSQLSILAMTPLVDETE